MTVIIARIPARDYLLSAECWFSRMDARPKKRIGILLAAHLAAPVVLPIAVAVAAGGWQFLGDPTTGLMVLAFFCLYSSFHVLMAMVVVSPACFFLSRQKSRIIGVAVAAVVGGLMGRWVIAAKIGLELGEESTLFVAIPAMVVAVISGGAFEELWRYALPPKANLI